MTEETPSAYLVWWNENHDWDFTGEGLYETHAKKCFSAGYAIAATETDELRAEVARLREALKVIAQGRKTEDAMGGDYGFILDRYIDVARVALANGEEDA